MDSLWRASTGARNAGTAATPENVSLLGGDIAFDQVTFTYPGRPDQAPSLCRVSFTARAGKRLAVVGPSGAGKSTVLQLLLRLYDDYEVRGLAQRSLAPIRLPQTDRPCGMTVPGASSSAGRHHSRGPRDPQPRRNVAAPPGRARQPRRHFVFVHHPGEYVTTGGPQLVSRSKPLSLIRPYALRRVTHVPSDILYGRPDATFEEVCEAARAALIHDYIVSLPDGYNTVVGEHGVMLSGGQCQRLAIARVFLKSAPIVLLDEPTSALDAENALLVHQAVERLFAGKTCIIVTHTPALLANVDTLLVLENGAVADFGPRYDVAARCATFQRLFGRLEP